MDKPTQYIGFGFLSYIYLFTGKYMWFVPMFHYFFHIQTRQYKPTAALVV